MKASCSCAEWSPSASVHSSAHRGLRSVPTEPALGKGTCSPALPSTGCSLPSPYSASDASVRRHFPSLPEAQALCLLYLKYTFLLLYLVSPLPPVFQSHWPPLGFLEYINLMFTLNLFMCSFLLWNARSLACLSFRAVYSGLPDDHAQVCSLTPTAGHSLSRV